MLRTIKFVLAHPFSRGRRFAAIVNLIKWQISSRLNKKQAVHQFTQNSQLQVWKGLTGATGNIYCGLHEFDDMAFLLHFLRPDDLFIDIGANIGSYTILASAEIGAQTIAFEPVPGTFNNLENNIRLNKVQGKITALNIGLGSKPGILKFTKQHDTGNHVANDNETDVIDVSVDTVDHILGANIPTLIKIDVEGFETEVLRGAANTLLMQGLKAIIIELNGAGNRYGYDDKDIHTLLTNLGFVVMKYAPYEKKLIAAAPSTEHNTLYVRDIGFVVQRVKSARTVYVQNRPL